MSPEVGRTKAERSMDRLNQDLRRLRAISNPTPFELRDLRKCERMLAAARRKLAEITSRGRSE